jgi:hypothetical protein
MCFHNFIVKQWNVSISFTNLLDQHAALSYYLQNRVGETFIPEQTEVFCLSFELAGGFGLHCGTGIPS